MKKNLFILGILAVFTGIFAIFFLPKVLYSHTIPKKMALASHMNQISSINRAKQLMYGLNVDMSQLLPTSPYYVKNSSGQDLVDIAHQLGVNALRISSVLKIVPTQTSDQVYTKEQWDTVLNKMNNYGIRAMIIAETNSSNKNIYATEISPDFITQVQNYIINSNVADNPDVYAIDMKNEPIIDSHNMQMLTQEAAMLKQRYPHTLLTVGGWIVDSNTKDAKGNPNYRWNVATDAPLLSNIVDFYSPHIYGFDRPVNNVFPDANGIITSYINQLEAVANNKPILIGEFGSANGDSVSDQNYLGSSELQANTYYSVYQALNSYNATNIVGSFGYVMISRNQYPDSWALIKDQGNFIYPGAYVIQQFSLGHSDVALTFPYPNVPSDIRLTNSDYMKTNTAKVGDEVLVALNIDSKNTYVFNATPSANFDVIQPLSRNAQFGYFATILKLKTSGSIHISVDQVPACKIINQCVQNNFSIYSTDLIVN